MIYLYWYLLWTQVVYELHEKYTYEKINYWPDWRSNEEDSVR